MEVILLEKITNMGELGDRVNVKRGFGRNYLIPKGLATEATKANIEKFEARRAELEKVAAEKLAQAQAKAESLEGKVIEITRKSAGEGKLFGSVGSVDVVDAAKELDLDIERSEVRMPDGAIREAGEFEIPLHLHVDVDTQVTLRVIEEA